MISFAEEIAYLYFTNLKYFTIRNFNYLTTLKGKKQPGNVDIDLMAYKNGKMLVISCKRGVCLQNLLDNSGQNLIDSFYLFKIII